MLCQLWDRWRLQGSNAGYEHSSKMEKKNKKTKNKNKKQKQKQKQKKQKQKQKKKNKNKNKKTLHFDVHVYQEDVVWQFF